MSDRNIVQVLRSVREAIPGDEYKELRARLRKIADDSLIRPPEMQYLSWREATWLLDDGINPDTETRRTVAQIFTGRTD